MKSLDSKHFIVIPVCEEVNERRRIEQQTERSCFHQHRVAAVPGVQAVLFFY